MTKMKRMKPALLLALLAFSLLLGIPQSVLAHDFDLGLNDPIEITLSDVESYAHVDGDPFKGWLNLFVSNTGNEAWGDFHFEIYAVGSITNIENVHFLDATMTGGLDPISSQTGFVWEIDNDAVGATLDLYFYGDPVLPGEMAQFSVYTDNQDQLASFGTSFYASPVPVPAAIWLLGSGLACALGIKMRGRA